MRGEAIYTPDVGERPDIIPELGRRIGEIAEMNGGRKQLADLLGITYGTLCSWIRGEREPRAYYLRRLAHLGNTTADAILCDRRDAAQEETWVSLRHALSDASRQDLACSDQELADSIRGWMKFERQFRGREET